MNTEAIAALRSECERLRHKLQAVTDAHTRTLAEPQTIARARGHACQYRASEVCPGGVTGAFDPT